MLTEGGSRKPSDIFGAAVVNGIWPDDASISQIKQVSEKYRQEASRRLDRLGELERSRSGIMESIQSIHADVMYERLAKIKRDQNALVDNAVEIFKGADALASECESLQLSLVSVVEAHRPDWDDAIESGIQQNAAIVLATAKAKAAATVAESATWITERGARITSRLTTITPASWGSSAAPPATTGSNDSGGPSPADPTIKTVSNEKGRPTESEGDESTGADEESGKLSENESENSDLPADDESAGIALR